MLCKKPTGKSSRSDYCILKSFQSRPGVRFEYKKLHVEFSWWSVLVTSVQRGIHCGPLPVLYLVCVCLENLLCKSSVFAQILFNFNMFVVMFLKQDTSDMMTGKWQIEENWFQSKSPECILEAALCDFLAGVIIRLFRPGQDPADTLNPQKSSHHRDDKAHMSLQAAGWTTKAQTDTRGFTVLRGAALHAHGLYAAWATTRKPCMPTG